MKYKFFDVEHEVWHRKMFRWGLLIGLPLELAGVLIIIISGFDHGWGFVGAEFLHYIGSVFLCFGYVSAVILLVRRAPRLISLVISGLAQVGRTALTVYLMETIIATGLMYWWGMGWFNSVSRIEQLGLTCLIYASLVVSSLIWLKIFRFGPAEWLWRSLTYWKLQPMRR